MQHGRHVVANPPGENGHTPGTAPLQPREDAAPDGGEGHTGCPPLPRLLGLKQAAAYLATSDWNLRNNLLCPWGPLPWLTIGARDSRRPRKLIDRRDLDAWIEANKQRPRLPAAPVRRH